MKLLKQNDDKYKITKIYNIDNESSLSEISDISMNELMNLKNQIEEFYYQELSQGIIDTIKERGGGVLVAEPNNILIEGKKESGQENES